MTATNTNPTIAGYIVSTPSRYRSGFASVDPESFTKSKDVDHRFRETQHVTLRIHGISGKSYPLRFGVAYTGPKEAGRLVDGGPLVMGPHAETYGLATVLTAEPYDPDAGKHIIDIEPGDYVTIDGDLFRLSMETRYFRPEPTLTLITDEDEAAAIISRA